MADEADSRAGGAWEKLKGKTKEAVGDATDKPDLQREGQRQERMGEIESERASLDDQRDRLRNDNIRDRRRDL